MEKKDYIIALSTCKKLGEDVAKKLNGKLLDVKINKFADGEILVKSMEAIRNQDIYVIQSTCAPVNDNIMELLIAIDSFKRASAKTINVIIPYFGYARQDRKSSGREPITAKLVAKMLEESGADRVCIFDLHSEQEQGFFDIPVDILPATYMLMNEIEKDHDLSNAVMVSPDYGSVKKARNMAEKYQLPLAILDKRRVRPNEAEIVSMLGDVKDKDCIIVDDMIDTGGTMIAACQTLKNLGAKKIIIGATHGLFSGKATELFNEALSNKIIEKLYVTNSIHLVEDSKINGLKVIDLSSYVKCIIDVYQGRTHSVSKIYERLKK